MQIQLIIRLLGALSIAVLLYLGYSHIKSIGYNEAEAKYVEIIRKDKESLSKKIDSIETLSTTLAKDTKVSSTKLSADIQTITNSMKGKTLTIIKDGECIPSKTFSEGISAINVRTNQTIEDSQK